MVLEQIDFQPQLFRVSLDLFDGPIDLLLHLVKQNELPIEKLSLAQVTSQYLSCIQSVEDLDLEAAGEYLVIAATLVSIKSSVLLNEPVQFVTDEDGNLVDPHAELLRKLREAQIYKDGAKMLGSRNLLGIDVFAPAAVVFPGEEGKVTLRSHDAMLLGKALYKIMSRSGASAALMTIAVDSIPIVERMLGVLDRLKRGQQGALKFEELIPSDFERGAVIGTFLALLELCKRQVVQVRQDETFDEIYIVLASKEVDAASLASEYDVNSALASG